MNVIVFYRSKEQSNAIASATKNKIDQIKRKAIDLDILGLNVEFINLDKKNYMKELNREDFKADYIYLWEDEDIIKDYIEINNPEVKLITYNKKNSISYGLKGYYNYQDVYTKKYTLIDSIIYNFKQTLDKQEKYLVVCNSCDRDDAFDNLEPEKVLLDELDIKNLKSNERIFNTEKEANEYLIRRIKYKVNTLSDTIEYLKRSLVKSKADLKKCQKQLKKAELQFNEKYNNTTDLENNEVDLD